MIDAFYINFISWFEKILSNKFWYLYTAIFTFLIIWIITAPNYFAFTKDFHVCDACVDYQAKINRADHLLHPSYYPDNYHMAKTQFRITVALLAKITGIRSVVNMFILQQIFGLIFLTVACLLAFKITGDKIISAILTLTFAFLYSGKAAFVDTVGFTDSFAFCFLIIALYTENRIFLIVTLLLSYFTDERAIVTSFLVATYFFVEIIFENKLGFNLKSLFKSRFTCLIFSWILCFTIRYMLFKIYGFNTPSAGASTIDLSALNYIIWDGLKGFWLLTIIAMIYLFCNKRFFILFLLLIGITIDVVVTTMVTDLTRSIAYIFPIIFLSLYFVEKAIGKFSIRKLVFICLFVSLLSVDSFYITGSEPVFYRSIPVKVIQRCFFNLPTK